MMITPEEEKKPTVAKVVRDVYHHQKNKRGGEGGRERSHDAFGLDMCVGEREIFF